MVYIGCRSRQETKVEPTRRRRFSARKRQVAHLIERNMNDQQIAAALEISESAVRKIKRDIRIEFGTRDLKAAIKQAREENLM